MGSEPSLIPSLKRSAPVYPIILAHSWWQKKPFIGLGVIYSHGKPKVKFMKAKNKIHNAIIDWYVCNDADNTK